MAGNRQDTELPQGGYNDVTFIDHPSDSLKCSVCEYVLKEPHLLLCCDGQVHMCESCLGARKPCPCCEVSDYSTSLDDDIKGRILELRVRCSRNECQWEGKLKKLKKHLSHCDYEEEECPYGCGQSYPVHFMKRHKLDCQTAACVKSKKYLYYAAAIAVLVIFIGGLILLALWAVHVCYSYNTTVLLDQLAHVQKNISELHQKLEKNNSELYQKLAQQEKKHEGDTKELKQQLAHVQKNNSELHQKLSQQEKKHEEDTKELKQQLAHIQKNNSELHQKLSQQEKKHEGDTKELKQQLAHVQKNNSELHQKLAQQEKKHEEDTKELQQQLAQREKRNEEKLQEELDNQKEKLVQQEKKHKEDMAIFRKDLVQDTNNKLAVLTPPWLRYNSNCLPNSIAPCHVAMDTFTQHKEDGDPWYSPPFYSGLQEYKMRLVVYANGDGHGAGTHVSAYVQIIKGEHDDKLAWPYKGTVTWEIINCKNDSNHVKETTDFNHKSVTSDFNSKPTEEDNNRGWGKAKSLSHSELDRTAPHYSSYVFNNVMYFRVVDISTTKKYSFFS